MFIVGSFSTSNGDGISSSSSTGSIRHTSRAAGMFCFFFIYFFFAMIMFILGPFSTSNSDGSSNGGSSSNRLEMCLEPLVCLFLFFILFYFIIKCFIILNGSWYDHATAATGAAAVMVAASAAGPKVVFFCPNPCSFFCFSSSKN
jgi:hypothetical protein